jgi:PAS domain S-box-containing protein
MLATAQVFPDSRSKYLHSLLEESENEALLRITNLVQHLFKVPVAYMGLIDATGRVVTRIGPGREYGAVLGKLPIIEALEDPLIYTDTAEIQIPGFDWGGLRFVGSVPLRSIDGMTLGLLVIADHQPRPAFSPREVAVLVELACVLAGKMELRHIASQALESELAVREIEGRFRAIANATPVLMTCWGPDGGLTFVNRAWLDFTCGVLADALGEGWVECVHPEYRQAIADNLWQAITARAPITTEVPLRRHDGVYRRMLMKGTPRFDEDGGFAGLVGCLTDVGDFVPAS